MKTAESLILSHAGVAIKVVSSDPRILSSVQSDFSMFIIDIEPERLFAKIIAIHDDVPPIPSLKKPVRVRQKFEAFNIGGERWVRYYGGRASARWSRKLSTGWVWSKDSSLLYELLFSHIKIKFGEAHDAMGLHRVHAAGFSIHGRACLYVADSGQGKSTTLLSVLRNTPAKALSDDSPLVNRTGHIFDYPDSLGSLEEPDWVPRDMRHIVKRENYGFKWCIDFKYFKDRHSISAKPALLLIPGKRNGQQKIYSVAKWRGLRALIKGLVLGDGLCQGSEFAFNNGPINLIKLAKNIVSRQVCAAALLMRSKVYQIDFSGSKETDMASINVFVQQKLNDKNLNLSAAASKPGATRFTTG